MTDAETAHVDASVIVPTFNERACLRLIAPRLEAALREYTSEIWVVDDASPDGTAEEVRAREGPGSPWRLLERVGKRGLASAVLDGFGRVRGDIVAVMDADGSHPPELLPHLIEPIRRGRAEFVLASRHVPGGEDRGLAGWRKSLSWGASVLARPITSVRDPMSGYFAVKRSVLGRARLTPIGYKIGLEVLVKCRPKPIQEVPFRFEPRVAGESKLGGGEIANYLRHLARLYVWRGARAGRASSTR
jgi:dolichol-phosphate mannosyltransferase